jgi:hypothetical protein
LIFAIPLLVAGGALIVDWGIQVHDNMDQGMSFWDAAYHQNLDEGEMVSVGLTAGATTVVVAAAAPAAVSMAGEALMGAGLTTGSTTLWTAGTSTVAAGGTIAAVLTAESGSKAFRGAWQPNTASVPRSGSAKWRFMGTNEVGTEFLGPDRVVYTNNEDLINAMDQHGAGTVIDGAHGFPGGGISPESTFCSGTRRFFSNLRNPYAGQVQVMDINKMSSADIQYLGGSGQKAYVNWCWGGNCSKILNAIHPEGP